MASNGSIVMVMGSAVSRRASVCALETMTVFGMNSGSFSASTATFNSTGNAFPFKKSRIQGDRACFDAATSDANEGSFNMQHALRSCVMRLCFEELFVDVVILSIKLAEALISGCISS